MCQLNEATPLNRPQRKKGDIARSIGQFYEEASFKDNKNSALSYWIIFLALGIAHSGDSSEILSMNFVLSDNGFDTSILQGDFKVKGALVATCVFAGMMIGGLLTGAYGDQFGRRPVLLVGLLLNSFAGLGSALAPNVYFMCVLRVFSGTGVGAMMSTLITLAAESSPPSKRGRNVGFVSSFFTFGTIYVAIVALFLFSYHNVSWRIFLICCKIPVFIGLLLVYWFVPESARYYALNNNPVEAKISANRIGSAMGYTGPELEVEEIQYNHIALSSRKSIQQLIAGLYTKNIWRTTIMLQILWMTISFGAGLITWINVVLKRIHVSDVYLDAFYFAIATIPGNIAAVMLLDKLGRKTMLVGSSILSSVALFFFAQAARRMDTSGAILSACFFSAFNIISMCTLSVITSELFPTEIRSTGLGLCAATGRFGAMIAQTVNGALADRPSVLLLVTSLVILLGAVSLLFISDNTNGELSDTIEPTAPLTETFDIETFQSIKEEEDEMSRQEIEAVRYRPLRYLYKFVHYFR